MTDRQISTTTAGAILLWTLGFGLVLVGLFTPTETGELGLLLAGLAMVLNTRRLVCVLQRREQNAFDIGREYEQGQAGVRHVR